MATMEHYEKRLAELQIQVQDIRNHLYDRPEPDPDFTEDDAGGEAFYRRECESLKERMMEYAQKAEMWSAKYQEVEEALAVERRRSELLARSLVHVLEATTNP